MDEYFVIACDYEIECYQTESLGNPRAPKDDEDYDAIEEWRLWNSGNYFLTQEDAALFRARLLARLRQMNDASVYDRANHRFSFEPWLPELMDSFEVEPLYTIALIGNSICWGWECEWSEDYDALLPMIVRVEFANDYDIPQYYGSFLWENPKADEFTEFCPIFRTHKDAEKALHEIKSMFLANKERVSEILADRGLMFDYE